MLSVWLASRFSLSTLPVVNNILERAMENDDSLYIAAAAAVVVASNAARAILLYCGWFLLAEGIAGKTNRPIFAWLIPLFMIPLSYQAIFYFHLPSIPQFGFSAFFTLLSVLFLQYVCRGVSGSGYKILIQGMLVLAIMWLDVIPALTPWGFGMGELSQSVKTMAALSDKKEMLDAICSILFFFCASVALLMARLFVSYEKRLSQLKFIREREKDLQSLRRQHASARLYQEMQLLVHDLKRPLTSILGLANLLTLSRDKKTRTHGSIILEAAEAMDQMINEIKTPEAVRSVSVGELINYTLSQIRPLPWGDNVITDVGEKVASVSLNVNQIRFSRALVNLLDNAQHAAGLCEDSPDFVKISAKERDGSVFINIEDNGPGFMRKKAGVSSWGSTGLGLIFVKRVMEDGNCSIEYKDRPEGGTLCEVRIPAGSGGV